MGHVPSGTDALDTAVASNASEETEREAIVLTMLVDEEKRAGHVKLRNETTARLVRREEASARKGVSAAAPLSDRMASSSGTKVVRRRS